MNSKANLSYAVETMSPTESRNQKKSNMATGNHLENEVTENQ